MNCTPSYALYAHRLPDNVCPVSVSLWSLQRMHLSPASLWWHIKEKGYKIQNSCHRKKSGTSRNGIKSPSFLAVQNSLIGGLVLWSVCLTELAIRVFTSLKSDPTHLLPLGHLIRVTRRHDLTKKDLPTYIPTSEDSSNIHLWPLGNSEDFTDVPMTCEDSKL